MVDLETLDVQTQKYFNLMLPLKLVDLKKAYHRVSFECHPDHGGDEERFKAMRTVYDSLILDSKTPGVFEEGGEVVQTTTTTTDGVPLFKLGLGLGPTTNGRDCDFCDHRGYEIRRGMHYVVCEECDVDGMVLRKLKCRDCDGSGDFTQVHTRRIVTCRLCKGSGIFRHPKISTICTSCWGSKTLHTTNEDNIHYEVCSKCFGKGEIEIHNPVLPKGALVGRR